MAARITRDLYLQVSGSADGLKLATKAGRTALLELGTAAGDVKAEVERAFGDLGSNAPASARQIEATYRKTFEAIRANAEAVLSAPSKGAALQVLNAGQAAEAAAAAERQAVALRQVATAAATVSQRAGEAGVAERVLAVASEANAQAAEHHAAALRQQADVLGIVEGELRSMGVVQGKQTVITGQQRAAFQQLGFQVNDVATQFSSGTPPMQIFAQQSGQVIQALSLMGQEGKGFLAFLGGPWGAALTAAVVVAVPFVAKLIEGGDALEKETQSLRENADKTAIAERAKQLFINTEQGAIADVRALTEEIKKQNEALLTNAERLNIRSKQRLEVLDGARADVARELAGARASVAALSRPGATDPRLAIAKGEAEAAVSTLEARLRNIDRAIAQANAARLETQKDLADEAAKRLTDPIAAINRKYDGADGLIAQAKKRATAEEVTNGVLTRQLVTLQQQRKVELDAAQKRQAAANRTPNNDQIGREITVAEATAIARSIGGRVTSGYRSTDEQARIYAAKLAGRHAGPVARPGTSDHERGQAIDIAYGPGISEDSIKRAFRRQGVAIRQLLDEPAQRVFHVAFGKAGPSAGTIARQDQAAADKRARDAEAYEQLLSRANEETLRLKRSQVDGISEAADLDVASIEIERQRLDSAVDAGVQQRRWTQAQADAVKLLNATNATLKTTEVRSRERQDLLDRQLQTQRAELDRSASLLQLQADVETTNRGRRAIALRLLANDEAAARARAKRLIASDNPDVQAEGRAQLKQIDAEHPLRVAQIDRATAGPLDQYRQQIEQNVGDMNQALEGVKVRGLQSIEDGFVDIVTGTDTVGGAFKKMANAIIADLARIAAQKLILSIIGKFAGGGEIPAYATGGRVTGPGGPREDRVLAMLSAGEFVINAAAYQRNPELVEAINAGKLPRFADGGLVGGRRIAWRDIPSAERMQRPGGVSAPVSFTIDARGADMAAVARLEASLAELKATLPATIVSTVQDAQTRMYLAS